MQHKPVYTVMPDFGGAYLWFKAELSCPGVGGAVGDSSDRIGDHAISEKLHKALAAWHAKFDSCQFD